MNASPRLLHQVNQSTVIVQSTVPASHPSAAVLGTDRMATGVALQPDGLILTVHYVVLGADTVRVAVADGSSVPARVVALDFHGGIAVVATESVFAPGLPLGAANSVEPGSDVFLLAATSDGSRRASDGVVMSVGPYCANWEFALENAIATSARSPGLGGAPLVDARGQVIGISFLDLGEVGRFVLAIPGDVYASHREELIDHGRRVTRPPRAWAGFFCYTLRDHVVIAGVLPESPAARSGLRAGDVVIALDGERVGDQRALYEALWSQPPGAARKFRVFRGEDTSDLYVRTTEAEAFFA